MSQNTYQYLGDASIIELGNEDIIISLDRVPTWVKTSVTGRYLLELMRTPKTLDELTNHTCTHYSLPVEAVQPIVEYTVNKFFNMGIISRSGKKNVMADRVALEDFPLQQVWFNITEKCNLHCPHCFARVDGDNGFAPLAESIALLEKARAMGVEEIIFSGGEPTLHPEIVSILKEARRLGNWRLKLLTNGFLAGRSDGEGLLKELAKYVDDFQVSIDGVTQETHDTVRCTAGSFENACRAVRIIASTDSRVGISMTPLPENIAEIPRLYNLAIQLKANYIHLNRPKSPANPSEFTATGEFLTDEFVAKAFLAYDELLLACHKSYEDMRALSVELPGMDTSFDPASELISPFKKSRCSAGLLTIAVDSKGDVYPCAALTRRNELCFGNAFTDDLNSVYTHGRETMMELFSVEINDQCSGCEYRYYCGGGCRATAADVSSCDNVCSTMKHRYVDFWERLSLPIVRTRLNIDDQTLGKGVPKLKC